MDFAPILTCEFIIGDFLLLKDDIKLQNEEYQFKSNLNV